MIKLRKFTINDAKEMLAFTNDLDTKINTNFLHYSNSLRDFKNFIINSFKDTKHLHFAIDYNGDYAGTVSLKNINKKRRTAEFAIIVHPSFRGRGIANQALNLILKKAKIEKLDEIFLNVFEDNIKAISLYRKVGFLKYYTSYRINKFQNISKTIIWMYKTL
jgi:diamine N-acetyltransferase